MAEPIKTKRCPKCKQIKSLSEFYKNRSEYDGLDGYCKSCRKIFVANYQKTERGKLINRKAGEKWRHTEQGKRVYKIYQKRYRQSEKGKAVQRKGDKNFNVRHPNQRKAKHAVNHAIHAGKLCGPTTLACYYCPKPAEHYHHWRGYDKKYWLDVVPVCKKCHVNHKLQSLSLK